MNTSIKTSARAAASTVSFAIFALLTASGLLACTGADYAGDELDNDELSAELADEDVAEDSEALCSPPPAVYINQGMSNIANEYGRYVLDAAPGGTGGNCWSSEKGFYSIGFGAGQWYLFTGVHCDVNHPIAFLGYGAGCSPTEAGWPKPAPLAVKLSTNSIPAYAAGDFIQSATSGVSQQGCWNRVGGGYSLGSFGGAWLVVPGTGCTTSVSTFLLAPSHSADPTELKPIVDITYAYYAP